MYWKFTVDKEWLEQRRGYLTASEVAGWFNKSVNPKDETIQKNIEKAVFRNLSKFPVETGSPSSDAARGHNMEPYAIREFNNYMDKEFYLYGNVFLCEDKPGAVFGYSPDALDSEDPDKATELLEVKCYGPEEHANAVFGDMAKRKERWQVAVGLKVMPKLKGGYVIWYSPNAAVPIRVAYYSREDLQVELEKLDEYATMYRKTYEKMLFDIVGIRADDTDKSWATTECVYTEEEIYNIVSEEW